VEHALAHLFIKLGPKIFGEEAFNRFMGWVVLGVGAVVLALFLLWLLGALFSAVIEKVCGRRPAAVLGDAINSGAVAPPKDREPIDAPMPPWWERLNHSEKWRD
jgi:hypothetical protein